MIHRYFIWLILLNSLYSVNGYDWNQKYHPSQEKNRMSIQNRYHPTTYSEESSEEQVKPVKTPQYAYEGGESHEGEIIVPNEDNSYYPVSYQNGQYHYRPPIPSLPPLPPKLPPTLPPHKSKDAATADSDFAYFYISRQLWYVPLYFSIYFIAYVGLLVLQSIARHKVLLPSISQSAAQSRQTHLTRSINEASRKYFMK